MIGYHVTTPRKLARYVASRAIFPPVRFWQYLPSAKAWALRTGRTIILRIDVETAYPDARSPAPRACVVDTWLRVQVAGGEVVMAEHSPLSYLPYCKRCQRAKKPIGRDQPLSASYCDTDCEGYREDPQPGLWWSREEELENALGAMVKERDELLAFVDYFLTESDGDGAYSDAQAKARALLTKVRP